MSESRTEISLRLQDLARSVERLERRVARLEEAAHGERTEPEEAPAGAGPRVAVTDSSRVLALIGQALILVGGAYLLRAITELGHLATGLGAALALAYSGFWLIIADRRAVAGHPRSAVFLAATATAIGAAVIWELCRRFGLLATPGAVGLTLALAAGALTVAARRRLEGLAWVGALAPMLLGVALAVASRRLPLWCVAVAGAGVGAVWIARLRHWPALAWATAGLSDGLAALLFFGAAATAGIDRPAQAGLALLAVFVLWLGTLGWLSLILRRPPTALDFVQIPVASLLGLGGALLATRDAPDFRTGFAVTGLLIGVALVLAACRPGVGARARELYGWAGLVIASICSFAILARPGWIVVLSVAAGAAALWTRQSGRDRLRLPAAVTATAAAAAAGALSGPFWALFRSSGLPPTAFDALAVLPLATLGLLLLPPKAGSGVTIHPTRWIALAILAWVACGWTITIAGPPILDRLAESSRGSALAVLRTVAVAGWAVIAAWSGRTLAVTASSWIAYALLLCGGVRVLAEDLPHGAAGTVFLSLTALGGALIATSRLRAAEAR